MKPKRLNSYKLCNVLVLNFALPGEKWNRLEWVTLTRGECSIWKLLNSRVDSNGGRNVLPTRDKRTPCCTNTRVQTACIWNWNLRAVNEKRALWRSNFKRVDASYHAPVTNLIRGTNEISFLLDFTTHCHVFYYRNVHTRLRITRLQAVTS